VFFVSRLRADAKYTVQRDREIASQNEHILQDQEITLTGYRQLGRDGLQGWRRITVWLEDKQEAMVLVTNHRRLSAETIAEIYRDRWQIEAFFKSIKQLLKLKTFVGTSARRLVA
jgi:IS4 transposase